MYRTSASRDPIDNSYTRSPLSRARLDMDQIRKPFFQRQNTRTILAEKYQNYGTTNTQTSLAQRRSRSKDYLITHDSGVPSNRLQNKENYAGNTSFHKYQTTNNAYGKYTLSDINLADRNIPSQIMNRPPRGQSRGFQASGGDLNQRNNLFAKRVPTRMADKKQSESPMPNHKEFFCMESQSRTRENLSVTRNDGNMSRDMISKSSPIEKKNIQLLDLSMQKEIGKGSYAVVKLGIHRESKIEYAVKTYEKVKLNDPLKKKSVDREIFILEKMNHPNIIKYVNHIDTRQ